jgi:hypothetical protein
LALGFALTAQPARGQPDPPLPSRPSAAATEITGYKNIERGDIPEGQLKEARVNFAKFAKYYADVINHPAVRRASSELKTTDTFNPVPTIDGLMRDLDRYLLEPTVGSKTAQDHAVYIRELAAALDAALKPLIEANPERFVRVNAARVLAHVCKSGSPVHWKTVTALLTDAKTAPEVKHYLLHAAGALLAAGDVNDIKIRKHAVDGVELGALVKAVNDCITNPAVAILNLKSATIPPDQLEVVGLIRRQAIRALGHVKWVMVPGPDKKPIYVAHSLVRIAMNDPSLPPLAKPADAAEAVIGISNMAPVVWQTNRFISVKGYNSDVAAEAVLQALITFAGPRAANINDKSLPWRLYSLRLAEALHKWRQVFDPNLDLSVNPPKFDVQSIPAHVEDIYKFALPNVLHPIEQVDFQGKPLPAAVVNIQGLAERRDRLRDARKKTTLFEDVPETGIVFTQPKKK